jgi:methylmalonyl-CoA mutase cobalamin-binding subunit
MQPINIMRRIIQSTGVVIHLGHDRSVDEVVNTVIQEDANAIALTSYQGGHMEYFKYMYDLLVEKEQGTLRYLEVEELFCLMKLKNCKLMELPYLRTR